MILNSMHPVPVQPEILSLPLALCRISAGFPSPADDHLEDSLDLNRLMVQRPSSTFFVRVSGDSMIGAGICSGDILVVDRAQQARFNDVVLAIVSGEFTVKRWVNSNKGPILQPENPNFKPIPLTPDLEFEIWGVVTYAIHNLST